MKKRILTGWTTARRIYLAVGILLLAHAVADRLWFGILLGLYISAMGLFAFGCAAGSCSVDTK